MSRTLVGGVGYFHLCDFSLGPALSSRLQAQAWPEHIVVEDLSYGPVIVCHRLGDERPPFGRWIVAGAARRGRSPGSISAYRWNGVLPDADAIQARVAEAVGGVIDLDNLVIVARALGAAPAETVIVEVEPLIEAHGESFSDPVAQALPQVAELVRNFALGGAQDLPQAPLGGAPA
jgi:Ni,Fe-hydrogenase maturation factor